MGAFGDFFNKAKDYMTFREFLYAVMDGNTGAVANYLNRNPSYLDRQDSMTGSNPLMAATMKGAVRTAKLLLERGASLRGQDKNGFNVLHMSIVCDTKGVMNLLLQRADIGTIINEKNRHNGLTALMYAAMTPDGSAVVQSLLEKGADPNMKDFKGRSALMIAREQGIAGTVTLLEQWAKKQKPVIKRTKPFKGRFDF